MTRSLLGAAAICLGCTAPLPAQILDPPPAARAWITAWVGLFPTVDAVGDPGTGSTWRFADDAFAFGAGAEYEVMEGLLLGAEAAYATTDFERTRGESVLAAGQADLLAFFATGRFRYGGTNVLGGYLKGMAGALGYRTPDGDGINLDPALSTGAGLEYRFRRRAGVYLEWNQIWAYHEKEGIDGANTGRHQLLRLGLRLGL